MTSIAQILVRQFSRDAQGAPYVLVDIYRGDTQLPPAPDANGNIPPPPTPWLPSVKIPMDPAKTDEQNEADAVTQAHTLAAQQLGIEQLATRGAAWVGRIIQVPA